VTTSRNAAAALLNKRWPRSPSQPDQRGESVPETHTPAGVRVTNLTRRYGSNTVLHGISFDIPQGGVCTLLGASGSGKTTTLRLLAGLDRPDGGEVWIAGRQVAGDGMLIPAEKRGVGLLFQSYALWPHMTVFDQISYPLKLRRMGKAEIAKAVQGAADMVGLGHLLDRYPAQLSGGQQQRVGLARALVFGPGLLLLDEPLSGLDAALRRQTRLELEQLQQRVKVTTVYVTHDQEEAMSVSDIVVVMSEGTIVSIAPPREIYDRPNSVYVASFVGASNLLDGTVVDRSGDQVVVRLADGATVRGYTAAALAVGDAAVLAIKPMDVLVRSEGETGENLCDAVVTSATYLGPQVELMLDLAGCEFRVPVQRWSLLEPGNPVRVQLPAERVTVLPPDGTPSAKLTKPTEKD
jgi:ABC-type Fe3+/spermidine/putrescine transport system ATPase subunit